MTRGLRTVEWWVRGWWAGCLARDGGEDLEGGIEILGTWVCKVHPKPTMCKAIGRVRAGSQVILQQAGEQKLFWNSSYPLTGFERHSLVISCEDTNKAFSTQR